MKICGIKKTGGVENLLIKDYTLPELKDSEVLIKNTAIGVGFEDVLYRNGI